MFTLIHRLPSCYLPSHVSVHNASSSPSVTHHIPSKRPCAAMAIVRNSNPTTASEMHAAAPINENEDEEGEEEKEAEREQQSEESSFEAETLGEESKGSYPDMAAFLEEAFKDDREVQEIIEKSFEDPAEMGKRVHERVKKKEKDILQTKTGSAIPMKVSFSNFDATDSYIWMELYSSPSEKDIDIIGSVIRSWYLLGCLGGYNSLNMQLTRVPVNERLSYNENVEDEILPARFNNIGELEFQYNWGRFWVDLGTSDPLALDVFVNSFAAISSDYAGIKEVTFGGKEMGRWNEDLTSDEDGCLSFKI